MDHHHSGASLGAVWRFGIGFFCFMDGFEPFDPKGKLPLERVFQSLLLVWRAAKTRIFPHKIYLKSIFLSSWMIVGSWISRFGNFGMFSFIALFLDDTRVLKMVESVENGSLRPHRPMEADSTMMYDTLQLIVKGTPSIIPQRLRDSDTFQGLTQTKSTLPNRFH